jgi:uncharacterized protein (TIGR02001 family)
MKKVIALLVAMSTTAVYAGVDFADSYIFRGYTESAEASIQPSMDTEILGLEVGAWANYNTDSGEITEVDFAVGYDVTSVGGVDVSVGVCEYTYNGTLESDTEASLYLDYSLAGVDLSASLNKVMDGTMPDFTILSASYGFDITAGIGGAISYEVAELDDDINGVDGEGYSSVTISAETSLTDALDVGVAYTSLTKGDTDTNRVNDEDDVFVVSISGDLF